MTVTIGGLGVGSALSSTVFVNQDAVWAQAQIVSGCLLIFMVVRYGILRFRRNLYNNVSAAKTSIDAERSFINCLIVSNISFFPLL